MAGNSAIKFATALVLLGQFYAAAAPYDPIYWVWRVDSNEAVVKAKKEGFGGVGFQAAIHNGSPTDKKYPSESNTMTYCFNSPALQNKAWAHFSGDALTPTAAIAHSLGLKVFANIEGINPHRWPAGQKYYTPELLKGIITDLHNCGADRCFEEVFGLWSDWSLAMSGQAKESGMEYQAGAPSRFIYGVTGWRKQKAATNFVELFSDHNPISAYYYHLLRDTSQSPKYIAQNSDLAYGFAKGWGKSTAFIYAMSFDWGLSQEYWPGVLRACCLIEGLKFRVDDIMLIGTGYYEQGYKDLGIKFDVPYTKSWINGYIEKQEKESRPVLNIIVQLPPGPDGVFWQSLVFSTDGITSGAFNAGYNIVCSTEAMPEADAYYIYTRGISAAGTLELSQKTVELFDSNKPVFLQCGGKVPSDGNLTEGWKTVLAKCGIDPNVSLGYGKLPLTGIYNKEGFNYTGYNLQTGSEERSGTVIPRGAVTGTVYASFGKKPLIVGKNNKYLISANCLSWQANFPISGLLSGFGVKPFSNVWGIAGKNVTALLAITDTTLEINIPNLENGARIHIMQWDKYHNKKYEDTIIYTAPYKKMLSQYDLIVIDS